MAEHGKATYVTFWNASVVYSSINCNYDLKDYPKFSQFYYELLSWWTHFRNTFDSERNWCQIIWNNKEIRIGNKPVYYKKYFESGILLVKDLLFHSLKNHLTVPPVNLVKQIF